MNANVLARHLDLTPLRGHRRGVTYCIFHANHGRTPSLSVDLDRGLFNCFVCSAQGGLRRFAELVGELTPPRPRAGGSASIYEDAVTTVLRVERAAAERRVEWLSFALVNGYIRELRAAIDEALRWAAGLGPDHPRTWPLLELAARVQTEADAVESEIDEILEEGRIG